MHCYYCNNYYTTRNHLQGYPEHISKKFKTIPRLIRYGPFYFCSSDCCNEFQTRERNFILKLKQKIDWDIQEKKE